MGTVVHVQVMLRRRITIWQLASASSSVALSRSVRRTFVTSSASPSSSSCFTPTQKEGDYYNTADEDEQDKILEEEEFAALNELDGDEYLPFSHRLAKKADAFDMELKRLHWSLFGRRQLLVDTTAATLSGRPTRADKVLAAVQRAKWQTRNAERTRSPTSVNNGGRVSDEAGSDATGSDTAADKDSAHRTAYSPPPSTGIGNDSSTGSAASPARVTNMDFEPFLHWEGVSSVPFQLFKGILSPSYATRSTGHTCVGGKCSAGKELATLTADLDYLRRSRALHALNYYSRINLIPKRHIGHALYQTIWNAWLGLQNSMGAFLFTMLREVREKGALSGTVTGIGKGAVKAAQFLLYGLVISPCIHIPRGVCNSCYGPVNFLRGTYMFDAMSGRWMRCTVIDTALLRHALQREQRMIRTVGRAEFRRKKLTAETKWTARLASMGFSVESIQQKFQSVVMPGGGSGGRAGQQKSKKDEDGVLDPYQTLGVRRSATQQQVKQQYKKLAMAYHPDVVGSRGPQSEEQVREAHRKFEAISTAYQILSNPDKRKAYDLGGSKGLRMHEGRFGQFMSRTPAQMVQGIFGGEAFRRVLIGDLLRSHWSLRFEAQVSVSLHELEELQCIRVRHMAMELANIVDVHAKRPTAGPYYKHAGDSGVSGVPRRPSVRSSSLPDPLRSNARHGSIRAGAAVGAGGGAASRDARPHAIERDLKEELLHELGDQAAVSAAKRAAVVGVGRGKAPSRTAEPLTTATGAAAPVSPYVLVPGSNEFNSFSKDFEARCDRFVSRMSEACFGPELLHEIGQAYVTGAQRFLGIKPFYAPKQLMNRKVLAGIDRIIAAFTEKTRMEKDEIARKVMTEYFSMEYDNVVSDLHVSLRYAVQLVLQDCAESEEVRRKRCYAVWHLGECMLATGTPWVDGKRDDADLMAYVQQAATSSASTSKPPSF